MAELERILPRLRDPAKVADLRSRAKNVEDRYVEGLGRTLSDVEVTDPLAEEIRRIVDEARAALTQQDR